MTSYVYITCRPLLLPLLPRIVNQCAAFRRVLHRRSESPRSMYAGGKVLVTLVAYRSLLDLDAYLGRLHNFLQRHVSQTVLVHARICCVTEPRPACIRSSNLLYRRIHGGASLSRASDVSRPRAALRTKPARREMYELVEDVELELQLNAVRKCLPCCLDLVQACVLESEDGDVKRNDQHVDQDEMTEHSLEVRTTKGSRRPHENEASVDVESADETFLEDEPRHLEDLKLGVHL
jgi:hypothetical protein